MAKSKIKSDERTITIRIPIAIRRRGGKKLVFAPDGKVAPSFSRRIDNSMVKALARAFRWQELLENGTYSTIAEIAETERINESYVGRILRLTLLAPDIVEAAVTGRHPEELQLATLMTRFPIEWLVQLRFFGMQIGLWQVPAKISKRSGIDQVVHCPVESLYDLCGLPREERDTHTLSVEAKP